MKPKLDVVMPVHNEANVIEHVIVALFDELRKTIDVRFIVSEDGSADGTNAILRELSRTIPIKLVTDVKRTGYSKAMLRGMRQVRAPFILCVDSDGQYNPRDFWKLWKLRNETDVVVGYRKKRHDSWLRLTMSRLFYYCFYGLFPKGIHDPSCSYILIQKPVIDKLLPVLGLTNEGFWWEFMARLKQMQFSVQEQVVEHRLRRGGGTRVYSLFRIPAIAVRHVVAMFQIIYQKK